MSGTVFYVGVFSDNNPRPSQSEPWKRTKSLAYCLSKELLATANFHVLIIVGSQKTEAQVTEDIKEQGGTVFSQRGHNTALRSNDGVYVVAITFNDKPSKAVNVDVQQQRVEAIIGHGLWSSFFSKGECELDVDTEKNMKASNDQHRRDFKSKLRSSDLQKAIALLEQHLDDLEEDDVQDLKHALQRMYLLDKMASNTKSSTNN